ncbi:hypothetical protein WA1_03885 [Scytonema hofmannii PCC 7110]|uniref:Uncharacterized protein n=1 Tax=Scytonema hofmannii PCC 7110 TaxID=128403 RepID=A0A139X4E6_9CYAN|nr:hypothetical protein [Scytonema hofmannii]KYC39579.1 hypothetical protein WA1_03885 [Scytonema hofmannii PCC 7110]
MTAALKSTIEGIKTLSGIPEQGKRFLSVNLALVDVAELMDIAKELGFKPELVQMPCLTYIEIHALLWHGLIADTPEDLEEKFDELALRINADAIRYATGRWSML